MTTTRKLLIATTLMAGAFSAYAASHAGAPMSATTAAPKAGAMAAPADMADGEIRKVDLENKKITIKHGVIKSLDMPGMTMVFQVKDPVMLDKVKAGDKIRFSAEKAGSAIVVTDIQMAK
jgi:Cu/Ag efflux protein CusF